MGESKEMGMATEVGTDGGRGINQSVTLNDIVRL